MVKAKKLPTKIDLGCGKRKQEGFYGVDIINFPEVDLVYDLRKKWPWNDSSVEEYYCSHFLEHFDAEERAHMVNEMYRTLIPGGKVTLIVPYGLSDRYFGDPTHKWPPITTFWFFYLSSKWRDENAPHTNEIYKCNFNCTWGYILHPELNTRSQEYQQFAVTWYVNSVVDIHCTMVKE